MNARIVQYCITALRSFFRHLTRTGQLPANPAADRELPRVGWRLPGDSLTVKEAEAMLAQPDVAKPLGLRDRAILEGGADIRYVQEMLGHARLDTTQVDTHVAITALKAIHAATHPGALLRPRRDAAPALRVAVRDLSLAADPSAATAAGAADLLAEVDLEADDEPRTEA